MDRAVPAFRSSWNQPLPHPATRVSVNESIRQLIGQISALEDESRTALHAQETRMFFQIKGKRIEFKRDIKAAHRQLKRGIFRWIVTDRPQNHARLKQFRIKLEGEPARSRDPDHNASGL